ncbi:MAG: ATP-binding protein [Candidatus Symbiothrix sp.]|jgi:signal transduction histidine kinase|nr:ATP-binding protein [Candidatus Symbiothrix sp.]
MRTEQLHFSANAKLGNLIGRELITNNIIAVFELVKNSYDAFADNVEIKFVNFSTTGKDEDLTLKSTEVLSRPNSEIVISDNGKGMSFDEIKHNWMEIGTTNKENIVSSTSNANGRKDIKRVINGEKGIGRFGADKLGADLEMVAVDYSGREKSIINIDWNAFNDHTKMLEDVSFACNIEIQESVIDSGVQLRITKLRDKWTGRDIINLKKQLQKMLSPFSQEKEKFNIFLNFDDKYQQKIENDSFEYANTEIISTIDKSGKFEYTIVDSLNELRNSFKLSAPSFGPISLRILYMDSVAKRTFTRKNGMSTKDYGNIRLFRDNFRVLPYGEPNNDWLGIDNKHAQAVFRTLGTRDIIGYVQITRECNVALKDATSRQGLNEDTDEFKDFQKHIWRCLELLQEYIFNRIKSVAEKEGTVIKDSVIDIKSDISELRRVIPKFYGGSETIDEDKKELIRQTEYSFQTIEKKIDSVEKANRVLTSRLTVMEKIVGAENILYDILHAIKNKMDALNAIVRQLEFEAKENNIVFDSVESLRIVDEVSKMVGTSLKRSAPNRREKRVVLLQDIIEGFIEEKKLIYPDINIELVSMNDGKIRCNVDGLRMTLDNLMSNSVKAMINVGSPTIQVSIECKDNIVYLYFEDNGQGINDDDARFIFNVSFTRTSGTGIGLSSSYHYMKESGGDINYIKNGKLGGALFELKFPLA